MNWKQIKKHTPKAFKKFVKWINNGRNDKLKFLEMSLKNERDLFDFFDEQGIYIGIVIGNNNLDKTQPPIFEYEILQNGEAVIHDDDCHFIRHKAEIAAFNEAFKILEKQ